MLMLSANHIAELSCDKDFNVRGEGANNHHNLLSPGGGTWEQMVGYV
jgi:hypothetical protein